MVTFFLFSVLHSFFLLQHGNTATQQHSSNATHSLDSRALRSLSASPPRRARPPSGALYGRDRSTDGHLLIQFTYTIFIANMELFSPMRYSFEVGIEAAER